MNVLETIFIVVKWP